MNVFFTAVKTVRWQLLGLLGVGVLVFVFRLDSMGTYITTVLVSIIGIVEPEVRRLRNEMKERAADTGSARDSLHSASSRGVPGVSGSAPAISGSHGTVRRYRFGTIVIRILVLGGVLWLVSVLLALWIFRIP